jgi:hypothetical protein
MTYYITKFTIMISPIQSDDSYLSRGDTSTVHYNLALILLLQTLTVCDLIMYLDRWLTGFQHLDLRDLETLLLTKLSVAISPIRSDGSHLFHGRDQRYTLNLNLIPSFLN